MINEAGQVWLVDFDKCERRAGEQWKAENLARLLRSLRKESRCLNGLHWNESDWLALLGAYKTLGPIDLNIRRD
jgi:3-deoxy-D-manno-octulosonic-acid transferase